MKTINIEGIINGSPIVKKCSQLIMGSGNFLRKDDREHIDRMFDTFLQVGGNTVDTAHQYGKCERRIGEWLDATGRRSELMILTKGAHHDDGEPGPRVNPRAITKDLLESLERLRTDYVDFYALHRDDPNVDVGLIMEVLNEHLKGGRIHAIGASNWTHDRIQEANDYAKSHGLTGFTFNSANLSLAKCRVPRWEGCVSAGREMCEWHEGNNMPLLAWSSQAGGFFTGRFSPDKLDDAEMVNVYYTLDNWERYARAEKLAEQKGVSRIQIALSYVLNQPFPTAALIGMETIEELLSSVNGIKVELSDQEIRWLDLMEGGEWIAQ
ncbi:aldo/keto reductase [Paenibacillus sp. LHD-38]|uniref:aldo/keto reductase n=1 Tax=Paenibacillus sp. LHD-38 TaxID=3072143 RepID=UPI00280C8A89|nr:aldo/keto reductase [Paenibacillus sp. LHD-38]MDQ8734721.1 aldo/keto reductase [Paenibacillus sp. LHD-38]